MKTPSANMGQLYGMPGRNCANKSCGKPLGKRQKKYCSRDCQNAGRRSPNTEKVWELRLTNPKLQLSEIAEKVGISVKGVSEALYVNTQRPKGLLKRKPYKARVRKPKPEKPKKEPDPLPPGKYGKHVAPGWLWRGGETLEKQYPQFAPKKDKK
jgi:hypothetical protein